MLSAAFSGSAIRKPAQRASTLHRIYRPTPE
jgi:hypothetical protein